MMKRLIGLTSCIVLMSVSVFANTGPKNETKSENAIIHIYRPSRLVGFGLVFKIKTDNSRLIKLKNGRDLAIQMEPGTTRFRLKKSEVEINLEAGKHYYLRASLIRGIFLGKPELVEVTSNQAQKDMTDK